MYTTAQPGWVHDTLLLNSQRHMSASSEHTASAALLILCHKQQKATAEELKLPVLSPTPIRTPPIAILTNPKFSCKVSIGTSYWDCAACNSRCFNGWIDFTDCWLGEKILTIGAPDNLLVTGEGVIVLGLTAFGAWGETKNTRSSFCLLTLTRSCIKVPQCNQRRKETKVTEQPYTSKLFNPFFTVGCIHVPFSGSCV